MGRSKPVTASTKAAAKAGGQPPPVFDPFPEGFSAPPPLQLAPAPGFAGRF